MKNLSTIWRVCEVNWKTSFYKTKLWPVSIGSLFASKFKKIVPTHGFIVSRTAGYILTNNIFWTHSNWDSSNLLSPPITLCQHAKTVPRKMCRRHLVENLVKGIQPMFHGSLQLNKVKKIQIHIVLLEKSPATVF